MLRGHNVPRSMVLCGMCVYFLQLVWPRSIHTHTDLKVCMWIEVLVTHVKKLIHAQDLFDKLNVEGDETRYTEEERKKIG